MLDTQESCCTSLRSCRDPALCVRRWFNAVPSLRSMFVPILSWLVLQHSWVPPIMTKWEGWFCSMPDTENHGNFLQELISLGPFAGLKKGEDLAEGHALWGVTVCIKSFLCTRCRWHQPFYDKDLCKEGQFWCRENPPIPLGWDLPINIVRRP